MKNKWNVRKDSKMIYHHMDEERMYPQSTMDTLMEELISLHKSNILEEKEIRRLFGEDIDTEQMREFWNMRVMTHKINEGMTNLEEDDELLKTKMIMENKKIDRYIDLKIDDMLLDLACGHGYWACRFADKVKQVHAVDYNKNMLLQGGTRADVLDINNIGWILSSVQLYSTKIKYDTVFISGVLLYLNDADIRELLKRMKEYTKVGTQLILREGTGIKGRYVIDNEYSDRLGTNYSAIYRTREEIISLFKTIGFELVKDEDMFEEGSELNKFEETRLRVYKLWRE